MPWGLFKKTKALVAGLGGAVFYLILCSGLSFAAEADPALAIREIPANLKSWEQIRAFVLEAAKDPGIELEEQGSLLTIKRGEEQYQVMLHKGDVIQFSTLAQKERGSLEPVQYGRNTSRSISPYLDNSPELKRAYEFVTRDSGVSLIEEEKSAITGSKDFRSALVYPEGGAAPFIQLSNKHSKHPVFGAAHEMQHFINQPLLPKIIDQNFPGHGSAEKEFLKSFLDEYLAVSFELETYQELTEKFPHLANAELNQLKSVSESELRSYVFQKWKGYYGWPEGLLREFSGKDLSGSRLAARAREFQLRFGAKQDLSRAERKQLEFDQKRNPKLVDETVIAAPNNDHLPWHYRPEAGGSFPLRTVWLPAGELNVAQDDLQLPAALRKKLIRQKDGKTFYAFFVHPMSEERFSPLIEKYESTWEYVATPSSSNRTLLVRAEDGPEKFYVKTSLVAHIAGIERTVPLKEVSRSVGHSVILDSLSGSEPALLHLPEPLAIIPKGVERGGQVVRLLRPSVPAKEFVSLFSFYDTSGGQDLTGDLARKLGISRYEFLQSRIAGPLLELMKNLRDRHRVVHEAHAQNVLVEVGKDGMPTGRFVLKDLAGVSAHLEDYPQLHKRLPYFGDRAAEYYQQNLVQEFKNSFEIYYKSGFLYGADQYLKKNDPTYGNGRSIMSLMDNAGPGGVVPPASEGGNLRARSCSEAYQGLRPPVR